MSFDRRYDDLDAHFESAQAHHLRAAQDLGFAREQIAATRTFYLALERSSNETDQPLIASGAAYLDGVDVTLRLLDADAAQGADAAHALSRSATSFVSTSAASATFSDTVSVTITGPVLRPRLDHEDYAVRLGRLQPALGDMYRAIHEGLYGTRADPERVAMWEARQAFDTLFDILAPDDAVRASRFWHPKGGDKPSAVHREERIHFAAHRHVTDAATAQRLAANARQMVDIYCRINQAHERGSLDRTKAVAVLRAMRDLLDEWIAALHL
jgi:hypothetical protein